MSGVPFTVGNGVLTPDSATGNNLVESGIIFETGANGVGLVFGANGDDIILHYGRGNSLKLTVTLDENDIPPMNYNNTTVIELTKYNNKAYTRIWINGNLVLNEVDKYRKNIFSGVNDLKFGGGVGSVQGGTYGNTREMYDWPFMNDSSVFKLVKSDISAVVLDQVVGPTTYEHFIIKDKTHLNRIINF